MDLSHESNGTSRHVEYLSKFDVPGSWSSFSCDSSARTNDDCDTSKIDDTVAPEKNVTAQEILIESCDTTRLTEEDISSFYSIHSSDNTIVHDRSSPCEENDCSTVQYNCSIMNRQDQDVTLKSDDARRHWSSSHSTRKSCFDQISQSFKLKTNYLGSNSGWRISLVCFLILLCTTLCTGNGCAIGLKTAGRTWPSGDIIIQHGNPLQIYCILNQTHIDHYLPGKDSSDLVFFRNRRPMGKEFVTIVNKTTIYMTVQKPSPSEAMYYCQLKLGDQGEPGRRYEPVCLNKVVVGFRPQKPRDFNCVSYNWENLTCSWQPKENYINTRFMLMFKLPGRTGGRKMFPCPKEFRKPLPRHTCMWDATTSPIYRQPYEMYTFVMNVQNVLGNASYTYKFNHYANVIPTKPENLTVINKTLDSALLQWSVPFPMQNFPPGLHHRIMYESQWDRQGVWKVINITTEPHLAKRFYNLSGLEYSNTVYDVRVLIRSASTFAKENVWSEFSHVTFRTPSKLPASPPRTNIGSFEITENHANRDIYLYWQAIPEFLENGNDFKYQIVYVEEAGRAIIDRAFKPSETTRTYAKFRGISFNNYKFEIASTNEVGTNTKHATIFVPSKREMPHEPLAFTKIAFEGGLYELSWKPPIMSEDIVNYTIFWCDNERDRPYQCIGYLDWVYVPKHTTIYNITVPEPDKVYQFAISANTEKGSSGMIWASCTVIHNKVLGKMKSVWINRIGSDFIEVGWKLDCSDRIGIVEGFNIYYCPILSPYNLNCKGPKLNKTVKADPQMIHGIVDNLMPYTTYMLSVAVLTKSGGEGLHSDPLYNTTLEAAPSTPPLDVKITNVTNTTMFITWKRPTAMNGVLRYYELYYNGYTKKAEEKNYVKLTNLIPYHEYNVSVAACTVTCSEKSPVKIQRTRIGVPGKITVPTMRFLNSSQLLVKWERPQHAAGPLDNMYYEIEASNGIIQNTTRQNVQLSIPDCKIIDHEWQYKFRIRAVNVANNIHLIGPWSDPGVGNCYSNEPSLKTWILIWILGIVACVTIILCILYVARCVWYKCQEMQDIEVKLPPGLDSNMKLLQKSNEQHVRQSSADTSGCSSGQESVTSSLNLQTESQVSNDSGTEVDTVTESPAQLLEDAAPSWEINKCLRQRNLSQGSNVPKSGSQCWDSSYVKVAKPDEPVLGEAASLAQSTPNLTDNTGYTASPHTWSSTGYISMPSFEELSNPSPVSRGENVNTSNTGARYCVMGSKLEDDTKIDASDFNDEVNDVLIPIKEETAKPYVSLTVLEQKQKKRENQQPAGSNDLNKQLNSFVDKTGDKFNLNTLAPCFTVSDKITTKQDDKPYILMEAHQLLASNPIEQSTSSNVLMCDSVSSTSLTGSNDKSFVLKPLGMLITSAVDPTLSTSTKPSVAASQMVKPSQPSTHITETKESLSQDKLHSSSHIPTSREGSNSSSSYVFASSVPQLIQKQQQQESSTISEEEKNEDKKDDASHPALSWQTSNVESTQEAATRLNPSRMPIIMKQKSGYVTIVENSDGALATTSQSDEQYSKMAVVSSTIQ